MKKKKKVLVGISGGVDSAVTAVLLQEQGYEVIAATFLFNDNFNTVDAMKVCKKLRLEHHIYDYRDRFNKNIIKPFLADYRKGLTPNPCVICNRKVKLQYLYEASVQLGIDYIATGHYAKIKDGHLFTSMDKLKDQTYFLCEVQPRILNSLLLPLEGLSKTEVRQIAKEHGLDNYNKKDSTDVCFIDKKFKTYLETKIRPKKGDIINISSNKKIGEHAGLYLYTIGQRRGLNIGGTEKPLFVVGKDIDNNILYVADKDADAYLTSVICKVSNINWINPLKPKNCKAKFRYHQEDNDVEIEYLNKREAIVKYSNGVRAVTPGQICAFYLGDECLGGGTIKEVYSKK